MTVPAFTGYDNITPLEDLAYSTTYTATCVENNQRVIIEQLKVDHPSPTQLAKFKRSANALTKINSPFFLQYFGLIEEADKLALVFEYFNGISVTEYIKQGPVPLKLTIAVGAAIAQALDQLHHEGISHECIKPDNILINAENQIKLAGFGAIEEFVGMRRKLFQDDSLHDDLLYISPEQSGRMNREVDYRTDFYSLGTVLYKLLTDRNAASGDDPMAIVHFHIAKMPPTPIEIDQHLPVVLSRLVMKLMAKQAEERYQSGSGLYADLKRCQQQLTDNKTIKDFDLAQQDLPIKLLIPNILVGRKSQQEKLLQLFSRAAAGETPMMLVSGESGIGKSALIGEIHKPIVEKRGFFVGGKFDLLQKNIPYSAILQCLDRLLKQILAEDEKRILQWKTTITEALGNNIGVVVQLLSNLELIVGPTPPVEALEPQQEENRFKLVFKNFISCFASSSHPLVIFLDDLQWADLSSLHFLKEMVLDSNLSYLFIIGAYRNNEVGPTHPLSDLIAELSNAEIDFEQIHLSLLTESSVCELIQSVFNTSAKNSKPLAKIVWKKTRGNPFFANQFIKEVYDRGLIKPSMDKGWHWDLEKINQEDVTDNVVELLANKMTKLSKKAQHLLRYCACVGNKFGLELIAALTHQSIEQVLDIMAEAFDEGMFKQTQGQVYFLHDRIQEAAYSLINESERIDYHHQIGVLLLDKAKQRGNIEDELFFIVDQLTSGVKHIKGKNKDELLNLSLLAANKAIAAAAYSTAINYLTNAQQLLDDRPWENQYATTVDIAIKKSTCYYLMSDFDAADKIIKASVDHIKLIKDKYQLDRTTILMNTAQQQYANSCEQGVQLLQNMGVDIKLKPEPGDVFAIKAQVKELIESKNDAELKALPYTTDDRIIIIQDIIRILGNPSYRFSELLFAYLGLLGLKLALENGRTDEYPSSLIRYSILAIATEKNIINALRYGNLSQAIAGPTAKVYYAFGLFVGHWGYPFAQMIEHSHQGYHLCLERGDLEYGGMHLFTEAQLKWASGDNLLEVDETLSNNMLMLKDLRQYFSLDYLLPYVQYTKHLLQERDEPDKLGGSVISSEELERMAKNDRTDAGTIYFFQFMLSFFFGKIKDALHYFLKKEQYDLVGYPRTVISSCYGIITLLKNCPEVDDETRGQYEERAEKMLTLIETAADHAPCNYKPHYFLAKASFAAYHQNPIAGQLYDQCIDASIKYGNLEINASANEQAALYFLASNRLTLARAYFREAYLCYQTWGSVAHVTKFNREYAEYIIDSTTHAASNHNDATLDFNSLIKASATLNSEIVLKNLLSKLMGILVENAGATKGCVLLNNNGYLSVNALLDEEGTITVMQAVPLDQSKDCPNSAIQYVARTKETLVINDLSKDTEFSQDEYFKHHPAMSVLTAPLLNKGELVGIYHLENSLNTNTFTQDRISVLNILTGQIAIAIENAQLYENLEKKVADRTAELAQKNRDIDNMLQNMHQGIFTILADGSIHHEYSEHLTTILETNDIRGRNAIQLLFKYSNVGKDRIHQMQAGIDGVIGEMVMMFDVNSHCFLNTYSLQIPGREEKILELDWDPISDDGEVVEKIMVTVRDVTELKRMQQQAAKQQRELDIIGQILNITPNNFNRFIQSSRELLKENRHYLEKQVRRSDEAIALLYRNMHTIKGNARTYGFCFLTDLIHQSEQTYETLRQNPNSPWQRGHLFQELDQCSEAINEYAEIATRKLHLKGTSGQITINPDVLTALQGGIAQLKLSTDPAVASLAQVLDQQLAALQSCPLSNVLDDLLTALPEMANQLGKPVPEVAIHGTGVYIASDAEQKIKNLFMHILRNSVDHGIELAEERVKHRKQTKPLIEIRTEYNNDKTIIHFRDDGAGLNLKKIAELGMEKRLLANPQTAEDIAELIFTSGLSTAKQVSDISGRGVGMDAVRSDLRNLGGDIEVHLLGANENDYGNRDFEFLIHLPAHIALHMQSPNSQPQAPLG